MLISPNFNQGVKAARTVLPLNGLNHKVDTVAPFLLDCNGLLSIPCYDRLKPEAQVRQRCRPFWFQRNTAVVKSWLVIQWHWFCFQSHCLKSSSVLLFREVLAGDDTKFTATWQWDMFFIYFILKVIASLLFKNNFHMSYATLTDIILQTWIFLLISDLNRLFFLLFMIIFLQYQICV